MREAPAHTEYHPKWLRTRISTYWWLGRWSYLKFILRELTSLAVAYFVLVTLLEIRALSQGPQVYAEFQIWLKTPLAAALNAISFLFVTFHAVTWFNLAPKAMVLRVRGKRVPGPLIAALNYVLWLAVSAWVTWLVVGG
jgi:fumarate reductase subunit C